MSTVSYDEALAEALAGRPAAEAAHEAMLQGLRDAVAIKAERERVERERERVSVAEWLALAPLTTLREVTEGAEPEAKSSHPYFSGRVHSVTYENADNAFYILKMLLDADSIGVSSLVTVKGTVPGIKVTVGSWFGFEAKWTHHETYGKQLAIVRAPVLKGGWDADTACNMLTANGVGSQVMQSIRVHFGDTDLLTALEDAKRLEEVPGLGSFPASHVHARWTSVKAHFKSMEFLSSMGLPAGLVGSVWTYFGDAANEILAKVPWALVEVEGINFGHTEEVARRFGLNNPKAQIRGAVLYACKNNKSFGNMFLRTGAIYQMVQSYLGNVTKEQVLDSLASLHKRDLLVIDRTTCPGTAAVYDPFSYEMESQSAGMLLRRNAQGWLVPGTERTEKYLKDLGSVGPATKEAGATGEVQGRLDRVVRAAIEEWGTQAHLSLSDPQKDGIYHALTAPVSILSGLPGTGKTTSLLAAVRILQDAGVPFLLCAPTGIAAKNLASRTGAPASTIHRAFAAKGASEKRGSTYTGIVGDSSTTSGPGNSEWGYGPGNTHPADVIILDEASMLDQHLLFRLLDGTKPDARLVFVGDHAQLPSVGPGNVLRDLIGSGVFPTVKLTQIFRQEDTSGIIFAAHSMVNGEVPEPNKDFKLLSLSSEEEVLAAVLKIAKRFFDERKNFQILSPRHNGTVVGVTNLNARLRELINPASPGLGEIRLGGDIIREGDRIMVTQNDYKLGVFNGDVGKVARVDKGKNEIEIKVFGDMPLYVTISGKEAAKLIRLAYACTVHKAQGLEYDYIVMPLVMGFAHQLQRNLLYTAITRAKKQVILIGHPDAMVKAVHNAKEDERATLFQDRLLGGLHTIPSA